MNFVPLINGKSYDWASITANIGGLPIAGITEISYKTSQEKVNNYGAGVNPVSRGKGRKESEASITLHMEEVERIRLAAPNRELLDLAPFDIIVQFQVSNEQVATHVIKNCEFTEEAVDVAEGDTTIAMTLPLTPSHIVK